MSPLKIFLASSAELKGDREQFEISLNRKNKQWAHREVFLHLNIWEDALDAMSQTRMQDETNNAVRACDLFVLLFFTKVGKYTEEEFDVAFRQFKATNKPLIFTYFKTAPVDPTATTSTDQQSLLNFKQKLDQLGHYCTHYKNTEDLLFQFNNQLDKLAEKNFIEINFALGENKSPQETTSIIQNADKIYNIGKIDHADFS